MLNPAHVCVQKSVLHGPSHACTCVNTILHETTHTLSFVQQVDSDQGKSQRISFSSFFVRFHLINHYLVNAFMCMERLLITEARHTQTSNAYRDRGGRVVDVGRYRLQIVCIHGLLRACTNTCLSKVKHTIK